MLYSSMLQSVAAAGDLVVSRPSLQCDFVEFPNVIIVKRTNISHLLLGYLVCVDTCYKNLGKC